ncbi:OLC1v1027049C1 [Oldenlandia corymbosa var. corymbosa]|uniref:OLC1v1027049C1 n=1 Tax=Oldenlandia corymbosa var. corymbosa TaxID=529605 RepID=A0AAV1CAC9_OLDCO|nr:OLC1v1027049C1 [Oldenlandia corymbosa var. corymbosa]
MGKIWVEVCLISARGLRRKSSLWKLQWYAVGWIDANNKYCTRIDASGNANPVWKTKFSALIDPSEPDFQDMALHVEVYSREPVFLREKITGTATVLLKEFLEKYLKSSEVPKPVEELGSFQLRKKNSEKPQGFVDISIRISEEKEEPSSHQGDQEGFKLVDNSGFINLDGGFGPLHSQFPPAMPQQMGAQSQTTSQQYTHPLPFPRNYSNIPAGPSYATAAGTSYQPPRTRPPPPPPSNVGFMPTFLPRTDNVLPSYINVPSSGPMARPGFGMGLGAGALAAGAVIFGDDFMSGFELPPLQDPSFTISTNPPF